jgi:pimeloyl-ACP methyl ester carboxylesterase
VRRIILAAIAALLIGALAVAHFVLDTEWRSLDDAARARVPGAYIRLPGGVTRYEMAGPPVTPVVVLLHAEMGWASYWDKTFEALSNHYRVLRFDFFGRGYSDRPVTDYTLDLWVQQLADLLDALQVEGPVDLVGGSVGALVGAVYADRYPERVRRIALIGPAGFPRRPDLLPDVGIDSLWDRLLFQARGARLLLADAARDIHNPEMQKQYLASFEEPTRYRGYRRSVLSMLRHLDSQAAVSAYERLGQHGTAILLFWARGDERSPYEDYQVALRLMPKAIYYTIRDTGHALHYERADLVNPVLIHFLRR